MSDPFANRTEFIDVARGMNVGPAHGNASDVSKKRRVSTVSAGVRIGDDVNAHGTTTVLLACTSTQAGGSRFPRTRCKRSHFLENSAFDELFVEKPLRVGARSGSSDGRPMIPRLLHRSFALVGLFVLSMSGCGGGPALRAAEQGDLAGVRRVLATDSAAAAIDADEARGIAHAVLRREIEGAKGDDGVKKLRELPSCAVALRDALEARGASRDEVAAVATLMRFDARAIDQEALGELARAALASPGASSAWRALEARSLVMPEDAVRRRSLFLDGDQAVRVGALEASFDATDASDVEGLLEAARLDPYPEARTAAISAVGNIGGERVVHALSDMFVLADEDERLTIIGAWASPRAIGVGGRDKLVRIAETETGPAQIAAAGVLVRRPGAGADQAASVLARAVETGSTRERVFAIRAALLELSGVRAAVVKAQADTDQDVALAALDRSLELYPASGDGAKPKERAEVVAKLMAMAKATGVRSLVARAALARAGVRDVLPLLKDDAKSDNDQSRKAAGSSLVALGEYGRAALLAADQNERVRTGVACALLRKVD
jgi:hypothetical protein